jgi:hypothetical protein
MMPYYHPTAIISDTTINQAAEIVEEPVSDEEFVGPFDSWGNVKADYGAVGDGSTDDTAAFQDALDVLGTGSGNPWVLWVPAGTYKITSTLTLPDQINVSIIGEDPLTTSIVWAGAAAGTMFDINGTAYSRFNRITWNGASLASIIIEQSWDGAGGHFDTGNEYADDVFVDAAYGIHGGFRGGGFSEVSILRSHFTRLTSAAVALGNFNALDVFVWYSVFTDCAIGMSTVSGGQNAGNFHVYNSIFLNSTTADAQIGNAGTFNFRNNYSSGSNRFVWATGSGSNNLITVQGNTILDTTLEAAVWSADSGPVILVDNVIRSGVGATDPPVVVVVASRGNLFSIGNTFTVSPNYTTDGTTHSIDDATVDRSTINPAVPTLPGTPPNYNRTIFEVTHSQSTAAMQTVINNAVAAGSRSVVHFSAPSNYIMTTSLVVPANSDIQIIGDGKGISILSGDGVYTGYILTLTGPSKVILRDLDVRGWASIANSILITNADQAGSRVFGEQLLLSGGSNNLYVNGLDYCNVQLHNFYHQDWGSTSTFSVKVVGGTQAALGNWLGGNVNIFSGASATLYGVYDVSNGAHVMVRDIWYEKSSPEAFRRFLKATGNGTFTYNGGRISLPNDETIHAIDIVDMTGKVTMLDFLGDASLVVNGNCSGGKVLTIGACGSNLAPNPFLFDTSSPAATVLHLNPFINGTQLSEIGSYDETFIRELLAQVRANQPALIDDLPAGVTDVRMYRVNTQSSIIGIEIRAGS